MIRAGFLLADDRLDMIALARNGAAAHRLARRANALVLLDDGWSCEKVAKALYVDDDTVRAWHGLYAEDGFDGLGRFEAGGSLSRMSGADQDRLKAWVSATLPGSTRRIGAWIEAECGYCYEGRSGLVALCTRPMPQGPPAAGRPPETGWRLNRPVAASASISTARSIWKPARQE
jgi:transposase